MKILLLQPPIQDFYDTDIRLQPIGLCYVKAQARAIHPDVEIVIRDYHQGHGNHTIAVPHELNYLKRYWAQPDKSPFCGFYQYKHFGLGFAEIQKSIAQINPDIVGISSLFSPYHREVFTVAKLIKQWRDVPVVVGGSHVNACPEQVLSNPAVDYIIRGEGERGFVEFIDFIKGMKDLQQVSGLGYKRAGQMVMNPIVEGYDLNAIPIPDLSDFSPQDYLFVGKPMTFMITSRSCPHRCSFCSVHQTFGDNYRRRNVDSIMQEIELRFAQGYRVIDFEDDNLTFFKAGMKELCQRLIARFPNGEMEFVAMNGISYISLDDELLQLMRAAGFTHLNLALVSSDHLVREATKRPHTVEKYIATVQQAQRLGFQIVSYQILGLPGETLASMVQTLAFAAGQPVLLGASMFYLTPDSPIAKKFPLMTGEDIFKSRLTAMVYEGQDFCRDDIYTLFITTRIIDFLKDLEFSDGESLQSILAAALKNPRQRIGMELLRRLWREKKLYFHTRQGLIENPAFKFDLFVEVLQQVPSLCSRQNKKLLVSSALHAIQHDRHSHVTEHIGGTTCAGDNPVYS